MSKYLYIKNYNQNDKVDRLIFNSSKELFNYLQEGEKVFNAGFTNAEIHLHRIEEKGERAI